MNDEDKKACVSVGFFLFLCLVFIFFTNFADACTKAFLRYENSIKGDISIIKYDKEEEEPQAIKQNESGTLRLSRTSSKDFDVCGPIHI